MNPKPAALNRPNPYPSPSRESPRFLQAKEGGNCRELEAASNFQESLRRLRVEGFGVLDLGIRQLVRCFSSLKNILRADLMCLLFFYCVLSLLLLIACMHVCASFVSDVGKEVGFRV